jgi:hypothetical protein
MSEASASSSLSSVEPELKKPEIVAKAATPMSISFNEFEPFLAQHMPMEHLNVHGALNVVERVHNIVNLLTTRVRELNYEITPRNVEQIVAIALAAYDEFIAPLDIPGIPNAVEPMFDKAMRNLIPPLVRAVFVTKAA